MASMAWQSVVLLLCVLLGKVTSAAVPVNSVRDSSCPKSSVGDAILGFRDDLCPVDAGFGEFAGAVGTIEGDGLLFQKALKMVHKNGHDYVAVLFYASWCPFSRSFRPSFSFLSYMYPSIAHFAIEESTIRPSVLSKYGVHGFPTLFLLNSTMRVRYHGSRTLSSLVVFYSDVTTIKTATLDNKSVDKIGLQSDPEKHNSIDQESCPFPWARSPENLLQHETYLALATAFVLMRLLYLLYPTLLAAVRFTWMGLVQNVRPGSFLDRSKSYVNRTLQLFKSLKEPCKRSNLQEGVINARAWASKSLVSLHRRCQHKRTVWESECCRLFLMFNMKKSAAEAFNKADPVSYLSQPPTGV